MESNNKHNDPLENLLEKKSKDYDFATNILHDVLGALGFKKEEKAEDKENIEIPKFEIPEVTPQFPAVEPEALHLEMDLNKQEKEEHQILDLEHEGKKLKAIILSQKKEMEAQVSKMAQLESENSRLRTELTNAKDNLRSEFEAQINKATIIEEKYNQLAVRHEELKAKVRRDIRKIRLREKELTHKMELIKHDSETLLSSKDQKILQLKKYIDSLEFDIETLKEKIETLEEKVKDDDEKAQRVVRALRLSTSLLETNAKKKII